VLALIAAARYADGLRKTHLHAIPTRGVAIASAYAISFSSGSSPSARRLLLEDNLHFIFASSPPPSSSHPRLIDDIYSLRPWQNSPPGSHRLVSFALGLA